ncbi:hypothetical protein GTP46_26215 [Duganella sp. FT135W]|uniref:Prepilin-type N-terminal cleavage/methylation domain-containing protein n=1 Tax=Duganella flavida TaxID=2692175 RepID=A0A6L8KNG0_9BURK|nr:type II secretion system protein [Duganella flavida]MYM26131.1 hypothetical protein [Duganella flavida]
MIFLAMFVSAKQRGASLLEFAVTVSVIGILMALLLQRIWYYQDEAEKAAVEMTVANVRAALEIKVVEAKLPGRSIDLTIFTEENPLNLLKSKPANYAGELFNPNDKDIGAGNWCFNRTDKSLIYLLNKRISFVDAQSKRLKFKVKLFYLPQSPEPGSVAFEQVED